MRVKNFRVSFIWVETLIDLIQLQDSFRNLSFLAQKKKYVEFFDALRQGQHDDSGVRLPWRDSSGNSFWAYYLYERRPNDVRGSFAWEKIVPLKTGQNTARLKMDRSFCRIAIDAYHYPHGLGLIITFRCSGDFDQEEWVSLVHETRNRPLKVTWIDGKTEFLNVRAFAERYLTSLRSTAFGTEVSGPRTLEPFSIVSILSAEGVAADQKPSALSYTLANAVTNWPKNWQVIDLSLPAQSKVLLDKKNITAGAGDFIYAGRRGRTIWFPSLFTSNLKKIHSLGCYHDNLVIASLQVESLSELAKTVAATIDENYDLPSLVHEHTKSAVGLLGRLYGGARTYKSASLWSQIEQNAKPDVEQLRRVYGMELLHAGLSKPAIPRNAEPSVESDKLSVFVSYSHVNGKWLKRLEVHLKPLVRGKQLELWADTRIKPGESWRKEITAALARAKVAVLLISADFYASDFIAEKELPPLLEAERKRGLIILGVHINHSRFDRDGGLSEYQTINVPDQPIEGLTEEQQEKIFDNLARRIEELLKPASSQ